MKTYIFSVVSVMTCLGLLLYFAYCLRKMKARVTQIEQIVGFIPFKKLSTIIAFKKYIRNKYEDEGY